MKYNTVSLSRIILIKKFQIGLFFDILNLCNLISYIQF